MVSRERITEHETWPALRWQTRDWQPAENALISRRKREAATGPYETALVPHIADRAVHLPTDVLAEAEEVAVEIARFDAEASEVLGDGEIAPIASVLMRSESSASSQIENLTVGARQLALAELGEEASANARMVAGNVAAMRAAVQLAGEISADSILGMHAALMSGQQRPEPGGWRQQQVWIGGNDAGPRQATFVPPHHSRVPEDVADLVEFTARTDVPVISHAAIAHAQFETIHPFTDGNGRTGRALVHAMVQRAGLTSRVTVPISAGLLADTQAYVDCLTAYRDGDLRPIVGAITDATFRSLGNGRQLLAEISEIHGGWSEKIAARRGAAVWRTLDLLIGQPVVTVRYVQTALGVAFNTAQAAIDLLEDAGIVQQALAGRRRNRTWHAQEVTSALDVFAERAGRRG